jgi:hypothetical protein
VVVTMTDLMPAPTNWTEQPTTGDVITLTATPECDTSKQKAPNVSPRQCRGRTLVALVAVLPTANEEQKNENLRTNPLSY